MFIVKRTLLCIGLLYCGITLGDPNDFNNHVQAPEEDAVKAFLIELKEIDDIRRQADESAFHMMASVSSSGEGAQTVGQLVELQMNANDKAKGILTKIFTNIGIDLNDETLFERPDTLRLAVEKQLSDRAHEYIEVSANEYIHCTMRKYRYDIGLCKQMALFSGNQAWLEEASKLQIEADEFKQRTSLLTPLELVKEKEEMMFTMKQNHRRASQGLFFNIVDEIKSWFC